MKKLFLSLTLLIVGVSANAQFSPSNNLNYIKLLKTPPIGSVEDSVMVYDSSSSFVKMLPKSSIVAGYELKSNKQNSLAIDGTGTKYPTVDAVFNALATKFPTPTNLTSNYLPKWNGSGFVNSGVLESVLGTLEVDKVVKKTSTERNYIFEGDSRMATDTYNETAISEFLADASNFKNTGNISNFAVGGSSIAGMQSRYTSNVYPLRPNGTTVKEAYLFVLIGINDLTVANPDAAAIYNSLSSYATTAKSDGFKVVVLTTFYRQDFTILQEKARIDFNEYIKSNSNLFYAIIDTEAMLPPSKSDLFYYDVVHLRSAGNRLIADFVNKTFNSAFNTGNSYDRSFLQDTFTPRSNTLNIDSGGTFPLKISTTANEAYIHLRNSTSSSTYGGLIRSFGDNIGFYHGNGVVSSLVLNSDGSSQFSGSITASNINVGNALYFGGGNNYLTFGGGRLLSNVGVEATNYKLSSLNTAPATATSTGTVGEVRITATHIYICIATNTWVRAALTTWI